SAYRKDPATSDEVISMAKEKIQTYTNGILSRVNDEDMMLRKMKIMNLRLLRVKKLMVLR
ncbi:hypothetical protein R6Q59_000182, partial [Mikania micrantha]